MSGKTVGLPRSGDFQLCSRSLTSIYSVSTWKKTFSSAKLRFLVSIVSSVLETEVTQSLGT